MHNSNDFISYVGNGDLVMKIDGADDNQCRTLFLTEHCNADFIAIHLKKFGESRSKRNHLKSGGYNGKFK